MYKINNLLQQISIIQKKYDDLAEYSGEYYNVFDILGVRSDELSHSAILVNLLDAKGKHGQKDIFLKLFIEQIKPLLENSKYSEHINSFDTEKAIANKEIHIGQVNLQKAEGGRVDIVVRSGDKHIIIENKIYAGDQNQQLMRYDNEYKNDPIIYLTLNGDTPSESSKGNLVLGTDFICISYKVDISNWLQKCIKEMANKPIIRETLNQYLFLIKSLTNQSNNNKMSEEILKILMKDEDSFNSFVTLINSQNKLKAEILKKEFTHDILQNIANKHSLTLIVDEGFYFGITYKGFSFKNKSLDNENLSIRFDYQSSNYRDILFGLIYIDNTKINDLRSVIIKEKFEKAFGIANENGNFASYLIKSKWTNNLSDIGSLNKLNDLIYGDLKNDLQNDLDEIVSKLLELLNE
tara:strand:- start:21232 stop:22455 length:1224 start_codon:yes stop_codon:yes gene_type:complete